MNSSDNYYFLFCRKATKEESKDGKGEINCPKHSEVYPLNYGKIGLCYIFNHEVSSNFYPSLYSF